MSTNRPLLLSMCSAAVLLGVLLIAPTTTAHAGLQTGLLAAYEFEHNTNDSSGNARHGTASGGVSYTTGTSGSAALLDGASGVITLPGDLWVGDFSTSFFVRTTATAPGGTEWWQGLGIVDGETCGSPVGGDFGIAMINGGHVVTANVTGTKQINDGAFHSVIVTRSSVTDTVKTYVDGTLDTAYYLNFAGFTGMPWIGVGNNPCDAGFNRLWFAGAVDELRFYDRVLTPAEITQLAGPTVVAAPVSSEFDPSFTGIFPNPASGNTSLQFAIPRAMNTQLAIYDLRGARVRLLRTGDAAMGLHTAVWHGDDERGRPVAAGVYLAVLRAAGQQRSRKLLVIR